MEKFDIKPFVKWAGGKKQLLNRLKERLPPTYGRYYEPFIGGGSLLFSIQPQTAVINDTNLQLLNVYKQLKKDPNEVIRYLESFDSLQCDEERILTMRERYNQIIKNELFDPESAAYTIWINKHCFNGLYRVNSKGLFNVPFNKKATVASMNAENLRNIGLYLKSNNIEIREGDFECACADVCPGDFVYFDSPYIPMSETAKFTAYTKDGFNYYNHYRLAQVAKRLDMMGAKIMLSNNNVELVYSLYDGFNIKPVLVKRSINRIASKRSGEEVIITNY